MPLHCIRGCAEFALETKLQHHASPVAFSLDRLAVIEFNLGLTLRRGRSADDMPLQLYLALEAKSQHHASSFAILSDGLAIFD